MLQLGITEIFLQEDFNEDREKTIVSLHLPDIYHQYPDTGSSLYQTGRDTCAGTRSRSRPGTGKGYQTDGGQLPAPH
jgi:hypothetical protein